MLQENKIISQALTNLDTQIPQKQNNNKVLPHWIEQYVKGFF